MNLGVKITLFLVETPKSSCLQVSSLGETLPEFSVKKSWNGEKFSHLHSLGSL